MGSIIATAENLRTHFISTLNSTTTLLGAGSDFLGTWEDVTEYATVAVAISGNLGAEPGLLSFEVSHDGVTVDGIIPAAVPNSGAFDKPHILNVVEKYIRIRYTNGPVPQTAFRLQTKFSNAQQLGLLNRIGEDIFDTTEGVIVRAILGGKSADDIYRNVGVNSGNAINVSEFLTEVALDNIPGHKEINKFGQNSNINIGDPPVDVWNGGTTYTGQPIGISETVEIFSSNANDTSAGSGARTMKIYGLDAAGLELEEVITLNGTTAVLSLGVYSRVFRATVETAGGDGSNQGNITIRHSTTTANIFAVVGAGINQTTVAAYTVPVDKKGIILNEFVSASRSNGSLGSAIVSLRIRKTGGVYNSVRYEQITTSSPLLPPLGGGIPVDPLTDIKVSVEDVSDNGTAISASFTILLIDL